MDKETWRSVNADFWDAQQKYWKSEFYQFSTVPTPKTSDVYFGDQLHGVTLDFQNYHETGALLYHSEINQNAGKYQDIVRYATPGGLQQINQ
jgi:hypothetical protein